MIKDIKIPAQDKVCFKSKYQSRVFDHWQEIRGAHNIPKSQDFRPQNFGRHVTQIALVIYDNCEGSFSDRLIGSKVSQTLHINKAGDSLSNACDKKINDTMRSLLGQSRTKAIPLYFEGTMLPDEYLPIGFTALALPFSDNTTALIDDEDLMADTVLLAFEFDKNTSVSID